MKTLNYEMKCRLVPNVSSENEWIYLVNETLIGEECIVPLLEDFLSQSFIKGKLKTIIERQIDEENEHVEIYRGLLGCTKSYTGSAYAEEFRDLVSNLSSPTLKLYSLQALLEGVSLGALQYRIETMTDDLLLKLDHKIHKEEQGHVRFGFPFFKNLIELEGVIDKSQFAAVDKNFQKIFQRNFSGRTINQFFKNNFDIETDEHEVDISPTMRRFRFISAKTLVQTKREFSGNYWKTAKNIQGVDTCLE